MDLGKKLQQLGLKQTPGRLAILAALADFKKPVDIQQIITKLKRQKATVDQATVYRAVELFAKKGLIEQIDFRDGKYRYELQDNHHHHLVCESCGGVEEIKEELLKLPEKTVVNKGGFMIKSHSLEFFGLCQSCQ